MALLWSRARSWTARPGSRWATSRCRSSGPGGAGGFGGGGFAATGPSYPTDATGHFSFRFEATDKTTYIVRASSELGHFTDWIRAPELKAGRKNQGVVVPVLAPAWVRLQLVDELPKSRGVNVYIRP